MRRRFRNGLRCEMLSYFGYVSSGSFTGQPEWENRRDRISPFALGFLLRKRDSISPSALGFDLDGQLYGWRHSFCCNSKTFVTKFE